MANYVPASKKKECRDFVPTTVSVVAHEATGVNQHWRLYFKAEPDSVCVDMSVGVDSGVLIVSLHDYTESNSAVKTIDVTMRASGTKVSAFLDVITGSGYERYNFTNDGQGCRHWVKTVVRAFSSKGLIDSGNLGEIEAAMGKVWPGGAEAPAMAEGTFF